MNSNICFCLVIANCMQLAVVKVLYKKNIGYSVTVYDKQIEKEKEEDGENKDNLTGGFNLEFFQKMNLICYTIIFCQ